MRKNIKILYVEDEKEIRENTKRPLEYLCDKLFVASDGQEGLELYRQHNPDIVVSDIKMPNMNGIDMCKAIKKIKKEQHIVFTTAHSESSYFIEAIEMQVDGYILKPIDYDLVENKIKNIIKQINTKYKLQQQEILTKEVAKLQDNLLVVLDKNQNIIFSNDNFLDFFQIKNLTQFQRKYKKISDLFLDDKDFFVPKQNCIKEIQALEDDKRVVSMMNVRLSTPQAFFVSIKQIKETLHTIITFTEITGMAIEKKKLRQKVFTDELTDIYNRAYFNKELDRQISIHKKNKIPLCLIMFDIDKFKYFNDTYGHQTGDKVLKDLAKIIGEQTRATDIFARWGGEEFVIILPNASLSGAKKVSEHLRVVIENYTFANDLKVTCSFGISQFAVNDTREIFIKRADDALYKAKNNGRNRVEIEV